MKEGSLVSTFGGKYGNTSFVPVFANEACDGGFAYCWGALCKQDPSNSDISICKCPFVSSDKGAAIGVIESQCAQQAGDVCSYIHNGGPRSENYFDLFTAAAEKMGRPIKTCSGGEFDPGLQSSPSPSSPSSPSSASSQVSAALLIGSMVLLAL